jgi:hypothetical protein
MIYRFKSKTKDPIELDDKQYQVRCISGEDIQEGGFAYELSLKQKKALKALNRKLADFTQRTQKALETGTYNEADDKEEGVIEGSYARLMVDYQWGLLEHYTNIPVEIIHGLDFLTLRQIAEYVEHGKVITTDADQEGAEEDSQPGANSGGVDTKNVPAVERQKNMPDQAKIPVRPKELM